MITLRIVEDHRMVSESLSIALTGRKKITVTELFFDLHSARESLKKSLPDVLLLDYSLPDGNGLDFCKELSVTHPTLKVILYTNYTACNIYRTAMKYNAKGFLLKSCDLNEIEEAIEAVSRNEEYVCEEILNKCSCNPTAPVIILTPREKEILEYLSKGLTTKQIAVKIDRTEETVNSLRDKLLIKFGVKNVAELIKAASDCGFLK